MCVGKSLATTALPSSSPTASSTGQSSTGQSSTGQSSTGQSSTGQSTTSQSSTGQSSTGQSSTGQSSTGQSSTGQSTTGRCLCFLVKTQHLLFSQLHHFIFSAYCVLALALLIDRHFFPPSLSLPPPSPLVGRLEPHACHGAQQGVVRRHPRLPLPRRLRPQSGPVLTRRHMVSSAHTRSTHRTHLTSTRDEHTS